jgi:hypothetical protein
MKVIDEWTTGGEGTSNVKKREEGSGRGMITGLTKGMGKQ